MKHPKAVAKQDEQEEGEDVTYIQSSDEEAVEM